MGCTLKLLTNTAGVQINEFILLLNIIKKFQTPLAYAFILIKSAETETQSTGVKYLFLNLYPFL